MTNYKTHISTLLLTAILATGLSAQSAERTLVKSFNLRGQDQVSLALDGPVEVETWDHKTLRIQMTITLRNRPDSFLKSMITAGRYNLVSTIEEHGLSVTQPGMLKKVRLKSGELKESISYVIYAPEGINLSIQNTASAGKEINENNSVR